MFKPMIDCLRSVGYTFRKFDEFFIQVSSGMALGGILVRAIWAVIGTSLSGDLSKCNTTYPMIR